MSEAKLDRIPLFAVGDIVVITKDGAMTKGKEAIITDREGDKWVVEFDPQWCGYYHSADISHASTKLTDPQG